MTSTMSRGVSSAEGASQSQRTTRTVLPGRHGQPMVSGREALTLTEVKIAALVAGATQHRTSPGACSCHGGRGADLHLPHPHQARREERVEIVGEALCRGISPERDGRPMHRRESVVI